ncbi:hypothetical protein [uncultured Flavobacterium sp.]|uniref:hypothetical protein n=1 Tax=uncultured Flavobacterium sp. TaxID=165435 RepID=UPI0030EE5F29|tara:strand:- start:39110 stop:39718 length:609 start_codon:yes stop_codon:yes gene_type:complete
MIRFFKIFSLVLAVVLISSCGKIHIEELKKSSEPIADASKSVALISKNNVMLYEFDKEFEKNFQNKKEYSTYFSKSLESQLTSNQLYKSVIVLEDNSAIETIFDTTDFDYIITIEDVKIAAYFEDSHNTSYSANIGNSQKKKSTVRSRIKIYDKLIKKEVAEFYTTGESDYSERNYKLVVEKATEKSIENTIQYLKTGKIKF